jgi:hypothetical protein
MSVSREDPSAKDSRAARGVTSTKSGARQPDQQRVLELMRKRGRGSSLAALRSHMQELEREIERLRRTHGRTT